MELYQFNKNVISRYESHIEDGMYFLFNVEQNKYWTGNTSSYVLLNNFRYKTSIEQVLENSIEYFELDKNSIENTLRQLVDDLVRKGFIDKYDD
jgi:hypothetical protein